MDENRLGLMNISVIASLATILSLSLSVMIGWPLFETAAQSLATPDVHEQAIYMSNSVGHPDTKDVNALAAHSFGNDELRRLSGSGASCIIHHGRPVELDNYRIIYSHSETVPIYVTEDTGIHSLSGSQTKKILEGEVKRWSEVKGANIPIHLYGLSSDIKKKALASQMDQAGIDLRTQVSSSRDYSRLSKRLEEDSGALVLGLRSEVAQPKYLGSARRIEPKVESGGLLFDVPIYLYIRKDKHEAQTIAKAWLNHVNERATEDNNLYPLADRLEALDSNP